MDEVVLARALHVLAVVIWIGGAAMATSVILPAIRRGHLGHDRLKAFHAIERRFIWQARTAVIIVGITGFYMVARLDLWGRFPRLRSGDARHGRRVAPVHVRVVRRRAAHLAPPLPRMGHGPAEIDLCLAARSALAPGWAQPDYDLRQAQELGFAESEPWLDVAGFDTKYKLCLLCAHAFGLILKPQDILNFGIQNVSKHDINYAREKNSRIKLVAHAEKAGDKFRVYVLPQFVPYGSALGSINNEFNGIEVEGVYSDKQFFVGKGAGKPCYRQRGSI